MVARQPGKAGNKLASEKSVKTRGKRGCSVVSEERQGYGLNWLKREERYSKKVFQKARGGKLFGRDGGNVKRCRKNKAICEQEGGGDKE